MATPSPTSTTSARARASARSAGPSASPPSGSTRSSCRPPTPPAPTTTSEQEELYFVHSGEVEFEFGDGSTQRLGPGGLAWVDAPTARKVRNLSDSEDAVYVVVGGKDGYVGRDGKLGEGETTIAERDSRVAAARARRPEPSAAG